MFKLNLPEDCLVPSLSDHNLLLFKVKFSLRNCDLFPGTALQCKETFSLLFYEFDAAIHQVRLHFQDQSNHFASD